MKHQVNMLIACVFMAMFSGSSAECPPMPDGICLPGRTLNATACGYWENPNGSREGTNGRSDSEMAALGFTCMMTCGSIDQGHRANADPNGGPDCKGVYDYYNHNANCCSGGEDHDHDDDHHQPDHAAFGACQAAALTKCPHVTHLLNLNNTDMDRWGSDPEYAKHVIDEQQAWEQIKCICNDCENEFVGVWGLARHMCHLAKPCADGYTYCPSATDTPTHLQGGCDINGGCEMDDCCAGNGCADHQGESPEFGYKDFYGCSYSFHNAASGPSGEGSGTSGSSGSSGPSGEDPGWNIIGPRGSRGRLSMKDMGTKDFTWVDAKNKADEVQGRTLASSAQLKAAGIVMTGDQWTPVQPSDAEIARGLEANNTWANIGDRRYMVESSSWGEVATAWKGVHHLSHIYVYSGEVWKDNSTNAEDPGYAFGACAEAAYPKCPPMTHFLNLNGTDMDRWGSDPEYAKHVLDEQQAWEQMKCLCDHCERELEGVWPLADPMCVAARGGGGTDGCEGDGCCSSGTVFKDGKCVATYDGLLQACKDARGDWGWTCHADTDSCPK